MLAQQSIKDWSKHTGRRLGWLAKQIPCTQTSLSRWLSGNRVPGAVYRNRLAEVTGIDDLRFEEEWIVEGDLA